MGGTFDHLHKGHEDFILFASSLAKHLVIGVTDDTLVKGKQYAETIEAYRIRMKKVVQFCKKNQINCAVIPLHNSYGPAIESTDIQALAVTTATQQGGVEINHFRKKLKLPELPIHVFQLTKGADGNVIASTRVRSGDINRSGAHYSQLFSTDLKLNTIQLQFFAQAQGNIVTEPKSAFSYQKSIVVGDVSLQQFLKNNWHYDLGIFDNKTERTKTIDTLKSFDARVTNPAGVISNNLYNTLHSWKHASFQNLLVDGEEDLATVAAVLALPLGSMIYYGQPGEGMVEVEVTETVKERFFNALNN